MADHPHAFVQPELSTVHRKATTAKHASVRGIVIGALASIAFGCSTPVALEGDPARHGVLVLDAKVKREFILGIVVRHHVDDASVVRTDRLDERIPGVRVGDDLVFDALEPGSYAIARVTTESSFWSNWDAYPYAFRHRDLPEDLQSIEVRAGAATVVGPVTVFETSGFSGIETTIEWRNSPAESRRALTAFRSRLEPGPWADALDAQLAGTSEGEDDADE
ncbi:MAG: hypothetical protein AAF488_03435 [Planctomycetota bacterium]